MVFKPRERPDSISKRKRRKSDVCKKQTAQDNWSWSGLQAAQNKSTMYYTNTKKL